MRTPAIARSFGVLVVEDEPLIRQLLTSYLPTFGIVAFVANDADEAERLLRAHADEIDGTLIDLFMPVADGLETRRRLDAVKPGLRHCLMSGSCVSRTALPEGFLRALDKPFGREQLRACVEAMRPRAWAAN